MLVVPNWHKPVSEKCFQALSNSPNEQSPRLFLYFQSSLNSVGPHKSVILSVHFVFVQYAKCVTLSSRIQFPRRLLFCRKNAKLQLVGVELKFAVF